MAKHPKDKFEDVSVTKSPNYRQFKDSYIWLSKMGDVVKVVDGVEKPAYISAVNGCVYFWVGKNKYSVGRSVYETWVGEVGKGYKVIHINGVKMNNAVSNLKKVTDKAAWEHAKKLRPLRGVENVKTKETFRNLSECAKHYGYTKDTLIKIINGKYKSHTDLELVYTD